MNTERKNFIYKNEGFVCENCLFENERGDGFIRNHCRNCLYSLHLDDRLPGDRQSKCGGLMAPYELFYSGKKGYMIVHKCLLCNKNVNNMSVADDNFDLIVNLSQYGSSANC